MTEFTCGKCQWTGFPTFDLSAAGKLCAQCPKCTWTDESLSPADFNKSVAVVKDAHGQLQTTEYMPPRAQSLPPVAPRVAAPPSYSEPPDVLALVRDRLSYLTAEEARLEGIRADATARLAGMRVEAKKLRKMLAAAGRVDDMLSHPEH